MAHLGGGGFGTVYQAEHLEMKRRVALEVLSPDFACNRLALARFQREIEPVARLDHPNAGRHVRRRHGPAESGRRTPVCLLVIALGYATEADLFVADVNQSPFNVGTPISLEDFDPEQVADLNRRYGSRSWFELYLQDNGISDEGAWALLHSPTCPAP